MLAGRNFGKSIKEYGRGCRKADRVGSYFHPIVIMKLLNSLFLTFILGVFLIFLSYRTVANWSAAIALPEEMLVEKPSVEIRNTVDGHLAAWVRNHPAFPKTVFLLQGDGKARLEAPMILADASVQYDGKCVTFLSSTGQAVCFSISREACSKAPRNAKYFSGWGLVRQAGADIEAQCVGAGSGPFPPVVSYSCKCIGTAQPNVNCDSGGPGATECGTGSSVASISVSCSVSCGEGYYACCVD